MVVRDEAKPKELEHVHTCEGTVREGEGHANMGRRVKPEDMGLQGDSDLCGIGQFSFSFFFCIYLKCANW